MSFADEQFDKLLDTRLAEREATGKIASYSATYIRDRLRENKEVDPRMLGRIQRVLEACSRHLENK